MPEVTEGGRSGQQHVSMAAWSRSYSPPLPRRSGPGVLPSLPLPAPALAACREVHVHLKGAKARGQGAEESRAVQGCTSASRARAAAGRGGERGPFRACPRSHRRRPQKARSPRLLLGVGQGAVSQPLRPVTAIHRKGARLRQPRGAGGPPVPSG